MEVGEDCEVNLSFHPEILFRKSGHTSMSLIDHHIFLIFPYSFFFFFFFEMESSSVTQAGMHGMVSAHCNLCLLGSSDSPASVS